MIQFKNNYIAAVFKMVARHSDYNVGCQHADCHDVLILMFWLPAHWLPWPSRYSILLYVLAASTLAAITFYCIGFNQLYVCFWSILQDFPTRCWGRATSCQALSEVKRPATGGRSFGPMSCGWMSIIASPTFTEFMLTFAKPSRKEHPWKRRTERKL